MDIKQLKESFATAKKQYEETKGYGAAEDSKDDHMYTMIDNLYRYMSAVEDSVYRVMGEHNKNTTHLPKLTASQVEKLLDSCGAGKDFQVQRPVIWSSAKRELIAEFKK